MGKIIALDFGLKRTGLAITDDLKMFAFGIDTVLSNQLVKQLHDLNKKELFEQIVIGFPKRLNNEDTHITENVRLLKVELEKQFPLIPIILYDERFTSKMATQSMHTAGATKKQLAQKGIVDKVSATILLQSYLQQLNQ